MKMHIYYLLLVTSISTLFSQSDKCSFEGGNTWNFSDSKGNILTINTYEKNCSKLYFDSEFYVSDKKNICDFYGANDNFKIETLKDTLNLYKLHVLCLGENFDCKTIEITKKSYFFKKSECVSKTISFIPNESKISQKTVDEIHKTIDNMEVFQSNNIQENLKNVNVFIKKLEALAIYGDLKSFIRLIEFNQLDNPEISYNSRDATKIVLDLNYINTKKDSIQKSLYNYLNYGKKN